MALDQLQQKSVTMEGWLKVEAIAALSYRFKIKSSNKGPDLTLEDTNKPSVRKKVELKGENSASYYNVVKGFKEHNADIVLFIKIKGGHVSSDRLMESKQITPKWEIGILK
jgi:hypothetical protein